VNKIEILEELYSKLPNKEVDNLIDLILDNDPSGITKAIQFLNGEEEPKHHYNLFQSIKEKPIYKTVAKYMGGEITEEIQILKMLSSILTQIFIQCELRGLNPDNFEVGKITDIINKIIYSNDTSTLEEDIKNAIIDLGFQEPIPNE
jgi:hypothetical protein